MRRTDHGSLVQPAVRFTKPMCPLVLSIALVVSTPGLAHAEPSQGPTSLAALIADVASANQRLDDIGAQVQQQQESVNKAIVSVQDARDAAATAQQQVSASQDDVKAADAAIGAAQKRFDTFAAASYINGPSASLVMASDPDQIISGAAANQTLAMSAEQVMTDLQRARTEVVNKESAARLAKQKADQAVVDAEASQTAAVTALTEAQQTFKAQQAEINRLAAERKTAQDKLDAARQWSAPAGPPAAVPAAARRLRRRVRAGRGTGGIRPRRVLPPHPATRKCRTARPPSGT